MVKRITPPDEIDRLAENIDNFSDKTITNKEEFDKQFNEFFDNQVSSGQNGIREKTFEFLQDKHPLRIQPAKKTVFQQAGGKDLKQDRKKTAKKIVTSKKRYIQLGAKNVDLAGYDTKGGKTRSRRLEYLGKVRQRVVYASKDIVTIRGKQVIRYRDKKGRFVKRR